MIANLLACMLVINRQERMPLSVEDAVAPALSAAGLTTASARFDPSITTLFRCEFTTPLYTAASLNPWQAPYLFNVFTDDVDAEAGKPNEILNIGTNYVGNGSRRTLLPERVALPDKEMSDLSNFDKEIAAIAVKGRDGKPKVSGEVPAAVKQAVILLLVGARQSHELYALFVKSIFGDKIPNQKSFADALKIVQAGNIEDSNSTDFAGMLAILEKADTKYLIAGGHDLLLATQRAAALVASVPPTTQYEYKVSTVYGDIDLSGGSDSEHNGPKFLVIDTGGNDRYILDPVAEGGDNWASIVIDTNGNDKYLSNAALETKDVASYEDRKSAGIAPGPAGAFMGYSFLFDLRGDDLYRSDRDGLGSGRLGVAFLEDGGGNDTYDAYQDSIGFGMFGAGIVEDMSGNDSYAGFQQIEGVGQTAGFGALIDHGGNDTYTGNDTVLDFPASQTPKHANTMGLGAGNGTRRDYLDAHQLAGGIGLLMDDSGDDKYSAPVFSEGCGYLQGIGILRDRAGNDTYDGIWYTQGAAAHFAIGYLQDDQGDDHHTSTMHMAQGAGHDFSAGYLLDLAGNDTYSAGTLSLGAANSNGIGLFLDAGGDDHYTSSNSTLGQCGDAPKGLRDLALGLGVFCDLGGNDTYSTSFPWAKNGSTQVNWTSKKRVPEQSQLGVFYDK